MNNRPCPLSRCRLAALCLVLAFSTASACVLADGEEDRPPVKETKAPGVVVKYSGVFSPYANAIAALTSEARAIYADRFGFAMPRDVTVEVKKDPAARTNLWTDGDSGIFLTVRSNDDLQPPAKSGYFNVYGICHELGHIAMYRSIINIGLPQGVAQGWPHYAGSVVVDEVYKKLTRDLWPEPYNYREVEGAARLEKQSQDPEMLKIPEVRVASVLHALGKHYGTDKVMGSMRAAMTGRPYGKDVMKRFCDELVKRTGDQSVASKIPPEMLAPTVEWKVAEREITDKAVEGLVEEKDGTGVLLRYDDGKSDGKLSTSGSGHAVMFRAPAGKWALDGVRIYGSRYGEEQPPKQDFSIFICDANFDVIQKIDKPYADLGGYDEGWRKLDFAPVKVPQGFYVCIYFNPTYDRGFYMNFDKGIAKSHSRSALPWTFVHDVREQYDWMIRPHLVPAE